MEDDHALRDVLRRGLADEGFEPVPAADGATALRLTGDGIGGRATACERCGACRPGALRTSHPAGRLPSSGAYGAGLCGT